MTRHAIVSEAEWLEARKALLVKEKAFTQQRDELSRLRRDLPWVAVDKDYRFETEEGAKSLGDLFGDKSQLVVYHFMFGPDWEAGCKSCSFWADNFDRSVVHLAQRDVRLLAVSRAPLDRLLEFRKRMGWRFEWVSSLGSDFNFDYGVSFTPESRQRGQTFYNYRENGFSGGEAPGISVFFKNDDGSIYHSYSTYGRGLDMMNAAYHYLDLVPKGRDEDGLGYPMEWVKLRDEYTA